VSVPTTFVRWQTLAVCVLFQAYTIGLLVYCFTLWVAPLMAEFGTQRAPVVALASISGLIMAVVAPLAGWASDRMPIKYVAAGGVLCFALGMLLASQTSRLGQISWIYGSLLPVGAALAGPVAAQSAVTRMFDRHKGMALGISWSGIALGGLILPPVTSQLIQSQGWRQTHIYCACLGFVVAAIVLAAMGRERVQARAAPAGEPRPSFRGILGTRSFWLILLSVVPVSVMFASVQFNIGPLANDLQIDPKKTGFALSLLAATMIVAKLSFGTLADRLDHRLLLWSCVGAVVATVAAVSLGTARAFFTSMVFLGIAGGGLMPMVGVLCADKFSGAEYGRAVGLCFLVLNATYVGPWIVARMRDLTGGYISTLQIMLVLLVPAALGITLLRPRAKAALPHLA